MTKKRFRELWKIFVLQTEGIYSDQIFDTGTEMIKEIRRLRKAIENWRKYPDKNPDYEPCPGCLKLEKVLECN